MHAHVQTRRAGVHEGSLIWAIILDLVGVFYAVGSSELDGVHASMNTQVVAWTNFAISNITTRNKNIFTKLKRFLCLNNLTNTISMCMYVRMYAFAHARAHTHTQVLAHMHALPKIAPLMQRTSMIKCYYLCWLSEQVFNTYLHSMYYVWALWSCG